MKQRIITGAILLALFVPLVVIGGVPFYCLIALAIGWAMYELMKATEGKKADKLGATRCLSWPLVLISIIPLITIVGAFYPYFLNAMAGNGFVFSSNPDATSIIIPVVPIVVLAFSLFTGAILSEKVEINDVFMVFAMSIFLMLGGQCVSFVRDLGGPFIMFVLLSCFLTDSGAYFVGMICSKKFRTHKLNERISPKKTVEGSIGGIFFGTLIPILVTCIPAMNLKTNTILIANIDIFTVFVLAFAMSIVAQIGDLSFSAIKRHYDIKDYSNIFPGHGGVLDRLDSILFNMIFFAVMVTILATNSFF